MRYHLVRWLRQPKLLLPGFIVGGIAILFLGILGLGYHYTEHNPKFCVNCHTMGEPFRQWQEGTHAMVNCHACHRQSKWESLHQLWLYITLRPDKVIHHPELDHTICVQCHLTDEQRWNDIRETAGHKVHFERAQLECLTCHDQGIHNIARPEGVCVTCHSDKGEVNNKMSALHCTQCHNFLAKGKGTEGLLPSREQCLSCHGALSPRDHDAIDQSDCVTCHRPHVWRTVK